MTCDARRGVERLSEMNCVICERPARWTAHFAGEKSKRWAVCSVECEMAQQIKDARSRA